MTREPIRAFVSYKWETATHNDWVKRLAWDLRSAGIEAILDVWEVRLGDSFVQYMTSRIQSADVVLFIVTPSSVDAIESPGPGGALKFEMQLAQARRIAGDKIRIVPIYREGSATASYLRGLRYIDFRDDEKYKERLQELSDDLLDRIGPPPIDIQAGTEPPEARTEPGPGRAESDRFRDLGRAKVQLWGERLNRENTWDWHLLGHAIDDYVDAIRRDPQNQHPWTNLAYVLYLVGDTDRAYQCLERSFKLAGSGPNHPGNNYKQVKRAIDSGSYLSGGKLQRPALPSWFWEKHGRLPL